MPAHGADTIKRAMKDTFPQHVAVDLTADDTDYPAAEIDCEMYTDFLLMYDITETGILVDGDRIRIRVQFREEAGVWRDYLRDQFVSLYEEESTTPCNVSVPGRCLGERMRLVVTTDYTNATPAAIYFTITSLVTLMR